MRNTNISMGLLGEYIYKMHYLSAVIKIKVKHNYCLQKQEPSVNTVVW